MANYNRSRGSGLKIYTVIVTLLLIAAIVLGVCAITLEWLIPNPGNTAATEQTEENTSGSILGEGVTCGVRAVSATISEDDYAEYGVSTLAETAYSLTATAYDEDNSSDGIPQNFTYTAAWQNPSSEWASGKDVDDYYTVTPTGINTATASCLQAFGEPIIITATSDFNDNAYCTWQADYVARVTGFESDLYMYPQNYTIYEGSDYSLSYDTQITYGTGTVKGTVYLDSYSWSFNGLYGGDVTLTQNNPYYDYFVQQAEATDIDWDFDTNYSTTDIDEQLSDPDESGDVINFSFTQMFYSTMSPEDYSALGEATNYFEYFRYAFFFACDQNDVDVTLNITYMYKYNNVTYSEDYISARNNYSIAIESYPAVDHAEGNDVDLIY